MIIKKMILENIRSYTNAELDVPEGSLLLAGNIGSGKSTVLMAIDFALFGIRRSELSGASLLRNGTDKGRVELHFSLDDKNVVISRSLKRGSKGVAQDSGFISINGEEKIGTPIELKQQILDMLNYPKEALTKNDLLYRYTVYTSQDQMKQILTCDKEERLNTLRRVFGIDKYKRVSENAKIIISKLKERKKELAGFTSDLAGKKERKEEKRKEFEENENKLKELVPKLEDVNKKIDDRKERLDAIEKKIEEIRELKKNVELDNIRLKHLEDEKLKNLEESRQLSETIKLLNSEKIEVKENINLEIEKKKNEINGLEAALKEVMGKLQGLKIKKDSALEKKQKISELNNCPTCFQQVNDEHKSRIVDEEMGKLEAIEIQLRNAVKKEEELKLMKDRLNEELEKLQDEEKKILVAKEKMKELDSKLERHKTLEIDINRVSKEVNELRNKQEEQLLKLKVLENVDKEYQEAKSEIDKVMEEHKQLSIAKAEIDAKSNMLKENIDMLRKEIDKKEEARQSFEHITKLQEWLNNQFIPLMGTMEKHIMFKVHADFSSLFSKWFGMLVDNEAMNIRLDEEFTPVIEQNGYETDYSFLSGGEKTAAALSYRLALNQVINNIMSNIKTRSVIILDEPTDGFSAEQLDKMKEVLDELNISQVIIVSHEPKIESFVENVIRFEKNEHVSRLV